MHKNDITNIMAKFGFIQIDSKKGTESNFSSWKNLLSFESVFSDSCGREIYIIEEQIEKMFSKQTIIEMEDRVKAFIFSRQNNDGIRYNINLILLCPIDKKSLEYKNIVALERDKYTCRKIFLNSNCQCIQDELSILPFIPISEYVDYDVNKLMNLTDEINKISYNNEIILNELLSKEPNLKKIENELIKLTKGNGEC